MPGSSLTNAPNSMIRETVPLMIDIVGYLSAAFFQSSAAIVVMALIARYLIAGRARHHPDLVVAVVATTATVALAAVGIREPSMAVFIGAFLLVIPLAAQPVRGCRYPFLLDGVLLVVSRPCCSGFDDAFGKFVVWRQLVPRSPCFRLLIFPRIR